LHDDHRMRGAEGKPEYVGAGAIGQGREQNEREQEIAKAAAGRRGSSRDVAGGWPVAAWRGGQNGARLRGGDAVRTWAKYAQMNHPLAAVARRIGLGARLRANTKPDPSGDRSFGQRSLGRPRPPLSLPGASSDRSR